MSVHIDSYSFGSMTVDGKKYAQDLMIFPDRVKSNWWRKQGHNLVVEDLKEVLEYGPDVLVVGKGASGIMSIPPATREKIEEKGIHLIAESTHEACDRFNEQMKRGRRVVGAFHLTC